MPIMAAAGIGAAGAVAGGGISFLGAQSQSKAIRDAMSRYLSYVQDQRQQFLSATSPIRAQLEKYAVGDTSADPRSATINENYGSSLRDVTTDVLGAGVQPGGTYTSGARDRTAMLEGQNLAASRAQNIRDLSMADQQMALTNLPTYEVGTPGAVVPDPSTFSAGAPPGIGTFLGQGVTQGSQLASNALMMGPIYNKLMTQQPQTQVPVGTPGGAPPGSPYYQPSTAPTSGTGGVYMYS